jgi:cytochrome c oxidase subunit 2
LFNNYSFIYLYASYPAYGYLDLELDSNDDFLTVQSFKHSSRLEYVFAAFPTIIIIYILVPSLFLLYSLDEDLDPKMTIKVIGHQWFWNYEYELYADDLNGTFVLYNDSFDSVLVQESELKFGAKRLLEVDKRLVLPINVTLRFVITSTDVLHSWSIPEMGIKVDAVPGRLNQFISLINRPGIFYGQCSELCGVAHGFMPIVIHAVPYEIFLDYLNS